VGEKSEFFNKLLKTYHEEDNPPNKETEAEEVEDDVEDESIFQEEIVYDNRENKEFSTIVDSV
jgi:hypothetical protein